LPAKEPKYKSKLEKAVAAKLKKLRRGYYKYEIEKLPYTLECNYSPDFTSLRTGTIIEVKGYLDADDRRKMLAVKKQHPNRRIIFLFQRPDSRIPRMKVTHAEWAEKHGFECCSLDNVGDYV
jgi:hypothetical protein